MPQLNAEQKLKLEAELRDFHNEEKYLNNEAIRSFNSRRQPIQNYEGFDRQEVYDKYGHC